MEEEEEEEGNERGEHDALVCLPSRNLIKEVCGEKGLSSDPNWLMAGYSSSRAAVSQLSRQRRPSNQTRSSEADSEERKQYPKVSRNKREILKRLTSSQNPLPILS